MSKIFGCGRVLPRPTYPHGEARVAFGTQLQAQRDKPRPGAPCSQQDLEARRPRGSPSSSIFSMESASLWIFSMRLRSSPQSAPWSTGSSALALLSTVNTETYATVKLSH